VPASDLGGPNANPPPRSAARRSFQRRNEEKESMLTS
jgi:hypothetical protein